MAIKFNESGLRTAISQNKSAASNLEVAKNALSNIKMPENFSSSYKLRNIPFRIERVKKSVEGINSFIEGKIDEYKAARSKANESASFLSGLLSKFGFGKDRISPNMTNNPDYEYYTKTQAKNTTANNQNLFPYLDASLEQKYFKTMAQMRQTKTSSLTNLTIGVLKGMAKAGETTIKGYKVGQANSISINNPDWNYYANGDKSKINDYARPYKQETMSKVSKKYIQSLYNGFYNTKIGKELNNTAAAPFKTDGAVTKFAENMAHRATIMAAGRVPIGAGLLGFLSGKGEATQSYWSQTKIQSQIKQGKNIDNIFDIGNTYGNIKGATQGGSMAFQKATGARGIIDEILNKPWKRIVADAIAGGAETVAVAKANSIINGKGFKKTFEQMGGWKTVGASAATAGAISALGELARWGLGKLASGKNDTTTINESMFDNTKEPTIKDTSKAEDILNGKIKGRPMDLQFFANKQKKYIDLQNIEEIKEMYGLTDEATRAETITLLNKIGRLIEKGELDEDQNFYSYMMDNIENESNQFSEYANYDTLMKRLTVKEAHDIYIYTGGTSITQQFLGEKVLASNGKITKEQMIDYINTLDSALEKGADLKNNQIFNRGMTWEQMQKWGFSDYDVLKASEGTTFNCKNYISTGVTKEGSFNDREVLWRIKCDAGKNYGAYVNEISKWANNKNEFEYIMKRGAQIKIDNVDKVDLLIDNPEHGITYIDATILGFKPETIDKNTSVKVMEPPKNTNLIE